MKSLCKCTSLGTKSVLLPLAEIVQNPFFASLAYSLVQESGWLGQVKLEEYKTDKMSFSQDNLAQEKPSHFLQLMNIYWKKIPKFNKNYDNKVSANSSCYHP